MQITTAELRRVFDRIIEHVEERHGSTLEIDQDYYRWISTEDVYDYPGATPSLTMGQLTDDWANLQRADNTLTYEFVWFSTIARAIGELGD